MQTYLNNNRVFWKGKSSTELEVKYGVLEGSVLEPVLFIISINDLKMKNSSSSLYCDDTSLLNQGKTVEDVKEKNRRNLDSISTWFTMNKLKMNNEKTQRLSFQYIAEHQTQSSLAFIWTQDSFEQCTSNISARKYPQASSSYTE